MAVNCQQGATVYTSQLDKFVNWINNNWVVNWGRKSSMWPMAFGTACCAMEFIATGVSRFDIARFGMEVIRPSPRQADLMIVLGRITRKMLPPVVRLYEQMAEPKWVIANGACASTGGVFDTYAVVQGIDQYLPVDLYIPGCPPRPEALLHGILKLHEKVMTEGRSGGVPLEVRS
jgi:NADH-quinone oxidoreductase subunit B